MAPNPDIGNFFIRAQRRIRDINTDIITKNWDKAEEDTYPLYGEIVTLMLLRGLNTKELTRKISTLLRQFNNPFIAFGRPRPQSKERVLLKLMGELVEYITSQGIYIGQQNFTFPSQMEALTDTMLYVTYMLPSALDNHEIRMDIISRLELIKQDVIMEIEVPHERFRYEAIKLIDTLMTEFPLPQTTTSKLSPFTKTLAELKKIIDIIVLANKHPRFMEYANKHLKEQSDADIQKMMDLTRKLHTKMEKEGNRDIPATTSS